MFKTVLHHFRLIFFLLIRINVTLPYVQFECRRRTKRTHNCNSNWATFSTLNDHAFPHRIVILEWLTADAHAWFKIWIKYLFEPNSCACLSSNHLISSSFNERLRSSKLCCCSNILIWQLHVVLSVINFFIYRLMTKHLLC